MKCVAILECSNEIHGIYTCTHPAGPMPLPPHLLDPLHPFHHPQEGPRARAFTPDVMEAEEKKAFPEYSRSVIPKLWQQ